MTGMFLTISRCHVKAGNEKAARKLLEDQMMPNDGKKPGDVVPGLIGFGLMRAKKDPSMYGICTVWRSEEDFDKLASNPQAKAGGTLVAKLKALVDGKIKGEGFYIESL
jgi:heme-degrading monooxygenase HmoA